MKPLLIILTIILLNGCNLSSVKINTEETAKVTIEAKNAPVIMNGLMWQDEAYTDREKISYLGEDRLYPDETPDGSEGFGKVLSGYDAKNYCMNLDYAGYTDWYLPSKSELESLYKNKSQLKNNIPAWFFSSSQGEADWGAWAVDFSNGSVEDRETYFIAYVRCVRKVN